MPEENVDALYAPSAAEILHQVAESAKTVEGRVDSIRIYRVSDVEYVGRVFLVDADHYEGVRAAFE